MSSHVDVTGVGRATAAPDVVTIDLRVQCDGTDVAGALEDASTRMGRVQSAARDHGVAGADLQTTASGVHQRWADGRPEVVGYTAHQGLRLRVRDMASTGRLIRALAATAGDALAVDSIALTIGDPAPLAARARELAFSDARAKAEQYAALAGRRLGGVERVSDVPPAAAGAAARELKLMSAGDMSVEPGEQAVTAQVTVRWSWVD